MERAIRFSAAFCVVWSLVVGSALYLLTRFVAAMLKGQLLGGGGWAAHHDAFSAGCLGVEAVNLAALWGAARLHAWACALLTALLAFCGVLYSFLPPWAMAALGPVLWLSPSLLPALLLWCRWPRLRRGL